MVGRRWAQRKQRGGHRGGGARRGVGGDARVVHNRLERLGRMHAGGLRGGDGPCMEQPHATGGRPSIVWTQEGVDRDLAAPVHGERKRHVLHLG
eukprot:scaffold105965_cov63-Phaeocystis_antarctica.AAC.2